MNDRPPPLPSGQTPPETTLEDLDETASTPDEKTKPDTASERADSMPEPDNLLEKLRRGFSLPADPDRLATYEKAFLRHPNHLPRVFKRARPFLPLIVQQIEARDMPLEIALLPVVESAFDPSARSWQGAAGLWQFTESTARIEGLKIDWWYDGRLDPLASTGAALNYLQKLYAMTGDWLLALAAYNGGIGNVLKAAGRHRKRHPDQTVDFWAIQNDLPKETRHYVPQLLALAEIIRHDKVKLPHIPVEPRHTAIIFDRQISLTAATQMTHLESGLFRRLNAGYLRDATPPDGPHYLLLPDEAAMHLARIWQEAPERLAVQLARYRIRPGDSLIRIAQRHNVPVAVLKRLNRLRSNRIIVGRTLLVPATVIPKTQQTARTESKPASSIRHTVRQGESLWLIARRYGLSVRRLAQYNGLSVRNPLKVGMMLKIPGDNRSATGTRQRNEITHTVRKGDSLWLVARRYGVSTEKLKRWNGLNEKSILRPGQKLIIRPSDNTDRQRRS